MEILRSLLNKFPDALGYLLVACMAPCMLSAQSAPYDGPVIDMHVHAYQEPQPLFGLSFTNPLTGLQYQTPAGLEAHKEWTFEKMREHRIVKAMVNYNPDWQAEDPDRILGGLGTGDPEDLRRLAREGKLQVMAEMSQYYGQQLADDPALDPYFELAETLDIPVGYHIYPGGPPGGLYSGAYPGIRAANANPMQIENALLAHPGLRIYIMHAGWPYLEDMKALLYVHPQLYVDIGVISWALPRAEFHAYLQGLVDAGFGNRIMYGTDQMVFMGTFDQAMENVNSAPFLSAEQKADIFYNNAAAFLNLTPEEIALHKELTRE
ncbi:amidohydrolase family protein [Robiginitalea sp. SC105]|uniref:amidohydrolase family protein n=1 Tax=Robiginitalea sp. SC105 TaxID=2762332 RepID=UPI00163A00CD|nr:amidohydrolase family protein [Robiginitalea sp. SC105]MBC2839541.1 amidohydrolase family protein [Robiginitalea sp. SC105]